MNVLLTVVLLVVAFTPDLLLGKRNRERHNRAATSGEKKLPEKCVSGYCLPSDYNPLDLPSSDKQDVKMNLEVQ